jgi:hypothetical protein
VEECGPCPVIASFILVLQLTKKHGKNLSQGLFAALPKNLMCGEKEMPIRRLSTGTKVQELLVEFSLA